MPKNTQTVASNEVLLEQGKRIRALHDIISRPDLSFDEQIDATLQLGCRLLGTEIGKVGRQDPSKNTSEFLNTVVLSDLGAKRGMVLPLDKTFCQITFSSPKTIAISHVSESIYKDHPAASFVGMQSYIGCSINVYGEKFGTINFANRIPIETPFTEADKNLVNLMGSWISVMMERQIEAEELRKSKQAADAANLAKSAFLANMSHEIRTPLNAIIGYSELVSEELEELSYVQCNEDMSRITGSAKHLLKLINEVLDLAKIEAGQADLHLELIPIRQLIEEVIDIVQPMAKQAHNQLSCSYTQEINDMSSDMVKLRQILLNVISNANKFTDHGNIDIEVNTDTSQSQTWIIFKIKDTGIGIPAEKQALVFQAFKQADSSTTRKYGGTGLGLSITKRFCEMLGGSIHLSSEVNKGTTITIRLPKSLGAVPLLRRKNT